MGRLLLFVALVTVLLGFSVDRVHSGPAEAPRVSLTVNQVPLGRAVEMLALQSGVLCAVDAGAPLMLVTLQLERVPALEALRRLVAEGEKQVPGLRLVRKGEVWIVTAPKGAKVVNPPAASVPPARKITLCALNLPLRQAVDLLGARPPGAPEKQQIQWVVEPQVPDCVINLRVSENSEQTILGFLVKQAGVRDPKIGLERKGGVFVIGLAALENRLDLDGPAEFKRRQAERAEVHQTRRIACGFRDTPLSDVMELVRSHILPSLGKSAEVSLGPIAARTLVAGAVCEADPEAFLKALVEVTSKKVPGLRLELQDGKYHITADR
jgi:hypothetical protein